MSAVFDNFDRANSTNNLGTASGTGQTWVQDSGTWGILSNTCYTSTVSGDSICHIASGVADVDVYATKGDDGTAGTSQGPAARISDTNNLLLYVWYSGSVLYKKVAGSYSALISNGFTPSNGQVGHLKANGSALELIVDTTSLGTATDSFNSTVQNHGFFNNGTSHGTFNDFTVDSLSAASSIIPIIMNQRRQRMN